MGSKHPEAYLARWLRDPALQRPNAHMPALELTEADVQALAAYLGSLLPRQRPRKRQTVEA